MKYFDIGIKVKKMNGWERSLLELKQIMNGSCKDYVARPTKRKTRTQA